MTNRNRRRTLPAAVLALACAGVLAMPPTAAFAAPEHRSDRHGVRHDRDRGKHHDRRHHRRHHRRDDRRHGDHHRYRDHHRHDHYRHRDRHDRFDHRRGDHHRHGYRHHRRFAIPRSLYRHHRHYRPYYHGRFYFAPHHHHHRVYRFPVYTAVGVDYRPYAYCGDHLFASGHFIAGGPRFHLEIGF